MLKEFIKTVHSIQVALHLAFGFPCLRFMPKHSKKKNIKNKTFKDEFFSKRFDPAEHLKVRYSGSRYGLALHAGQARGRAAGGTSRVEATARATDPTVRVTS